MLQNYYSLINDWDEINKNRITFPVFNIKKKTVILWQYNNVLGRSYHRNMIPNNRFH